MEKTSIQPWFVAHTKPNSYNIAKKNLENQGIQTFLPLIETTKRQAQKFISELKPLFSGYIFVSFDLNTFNWSKINNTVGLNKLIMSNNRPASLPDQFIQCLKLRCDQMGKIVHKQELRFGESVEVIKGPFAELVGSIEKIDKNDRVTLLFEILGRKTSTILASSSLRPIN